MPPKKSPTAQRAEAAARLRKIQKDKKIQEGFAKSWDPLGSSKKKGKR